MRRLLPLVSLLLPTQASAESNSSNTAEEWVAPQAGWTREQLLCLNDMEEADATYDHVLNHHEYIVFAQLMADRIYGIPSDGLTVDHNWVLEGLYERLVLLNPRPCEINGLDHFGSEFGMLNQISEKQEHYLKQICMETKGVLMAMPHTDGGT
jgi:hypothetical protein